MPARLPSWVWVTGLTAGATAAVVALAVQADKGVHPTAAARPDVSASAGAHPAPDRSPSVPPALPADSGTGRRIVYSLGRKRVWLVDADNKATSSFTVWPGTVSPDPGTYTVTRRLDSTTGGDGVPIEHILYFAQKSGLWVAFSNATDGSSPPPAAGKQTSGIRLHKADGAQLWAFGTQNTPVTVVA